MADPYVTLGLARGASQDEIRVAYRNLAKLHHPDLNPGDSQAEDRFKAISAANEMLSDPIKRARFDRGEIDESGQEQVPRDSYREHAEGRSGRAYSHADQQSGGWSQDDLSDMFGSMFGEGGRNGAGRPMRGQDEQYTLTATFLDAIRGATRRLTLPDGRTLDVKIPVGTSDGQTLRLRNQGGVGRNGGGNGSALIRISVAAHEYFRRKDNDILLDLPVTLKEVVLGASVVIPTPGGPVTMRVPPGSDTGTRLRLRGRGVALHGHEEAGDLYATLRVEVGKPDAALESFLRDWKPEHGGDPRSIMGMSV